MITECNLFIFCIIKEAGNPADLPFTWILNFDGDAKDRLVHDQWKENKFQNHKYLAYFYMQDILYGQYFLIVILNSMTIS